MRHGTGGTPRLKRCSDGNSLESAALESLSAPNKPWENLEGFSFNDPTVNHEGHLVGLV